jgi:hypothetical protein
VEIAPLRTPADEEAARRHWKRSDRARTFRLTHWDYDADHIDGHDYDIGAVLVREATAAGESELAAVLDA